jgi:hypothetical protein
MRHHAALLLLLASLPAGGAEIAGQVVIRGAAGPMVQVGYVGRTASGQEISCMVGTSTGPMTASATCTTYRPRCSEMAWTPPATCTFRHTVVPPGRYVVYARSGESYIDWKLVAVRPGAAVVRASLVVDPAAAGDLHIRPPRRPGSYNVRLSPLDAKLKPPLGAAQVSMSLEISLDMPRSGLNIKGLRAGAYLLELRTFVREGSRATGYGTVYTGTVGSWRVRVKAGARTEYGLP